MQRLRVSRSQSYRWGAAALFLAMGALLTALGFEHLAGMKPCPLCLEQRWAYYFGIPATFVALVLLSAGRPRLAGLLFGIVGLAFLANAGLGAYHAGIEWGFWPGPDTCSGGAGVALKPGNMQDILKNSAPVVRCDAPAGRFAGLSFAGWNVMASLMLCTAAVKAAIETRDHEMYL